MITRYTKYADLADEFMKDRERALYWLRKMMGKQDKESKTYKNFKDVCFGCSDGLRSDIIEYDSPLYGNKWLLWYRFVSKGYGIMPELDRYLVCYQLTAASMNIEFGISLTVDGSKLCGVALVTDHVFTRFADKDRLGVNMTDRKLVIRNFVERVICGSIIDIRGPRPGEKNDQVICRLPASWLRGHIIYVGDTFICRFNTFYTDKSLSPWQRRYLSGFAKFADAFNSKNEIKNYFESNTD